MSDAIEKNINIVEIKTSKYQLILMRFKDNLPIGIAIATILGGINQFYNLLSIGSYYVRFFSATQLLSDGLWILYLLLPFYVAFIFMLPFLLASDHYYLGILDPVDKNGLFVAKKVIVNNLLIILIVYPVCYYFILNGRWPYASILLLMYTFPAAMANLKLSKKYTNEMVLDIFAIITIVAFLSSIYFTWTWTFKDNDIPENFSNKIKIENIIEEYNPSFDYKILYMNDKYIFSKVYCDSINDPNAKIFLISTENLTSQEN